MLETMLKTSEVKKDIFYLMNKYSGIISRVEVELLLSYIFKCKAPHLYINDYVLDKETLELFDSLAKRRLCGEPIQYITGSSEFMGMDFIVNKDVLIPRPETEFLIGEVLRITNSNLNTLDLCTGCGNIAISLARFMDRINIVATDISGPALRIARGNSILHGVDKHITFHEGDLFDALPIDKSYKFDIIVCNPPYVKSAELQFLQREVRYEPEVSLDGGEDGLEFYRRIERVAPDYLKKNGGSLFLEIGLGQLEAIKGIFISRNLFEIRNVNKDFSGIDRVLWISLL
ncbi:MAG: peptide chain release factor N(5)-glutamine methyltransferase [Candidatus Omnitrophica bacterium]|nr:peptide chain release factor N(5)-glutamine methyltransferase [Candidatus Omnitrophota bacterium]